MLDYEIEELIKVRSIARRDGNIFLAIKTERELDAVGVKVIDTPNGTVWKHE